MKKAIIYGAGNIGRGFIGQLFALSGYEICFVDVNEAVVARLNQDRQYNIYITNGEDYKAQGVSGIYAVSGKDSSAIAEEISNADIMATAVGVNALQFIAEPIARGIRSRFEKGVSNPLNVIVCENMIGADKYLAGLIKEHLNTAEKRYFDTHVGTVEPSIGRMVPATPRHIAENEPLAVCVEPYCQLPVDKDAFKGDIPEIYNMLPFSPFDFHICRKLYMHNMSHTLTAYLGNLKGYEYIWQANGDGSIRSIALAALEEISSAMSAEFSVPYSALEEFSLDLISRYDNKLLGDTVERVGKDSKRKLSSSDRFVGAIRLCIKHGITPVHIIRGMTAGFLFCPDGDTASLEVKAYTDAHGIFAAIKKFCSISANEPLAQLIADEYVKISR